MNSPHSKFRQRLLDGEFLVGSFVKTPSMMLSEVLAQTDLDVLCLDAEHSPFDRSDIDACLMAYRSHAKPALVRTSSSSNDQILNALDCGATGIVVPHVDSPEKASAIAQAARFGDRGRGYAGSTRAAGYGRNSVEQNLTSNKADTTVIAQIEDLAALKCIDAIAGIQGIDCLFIGMMDLTIALKADSCKDKVVVEAAGKICEAARRADRRLGIFVPHLADVAFWQDRGVSLFLLQSDHVFIKAGAAQLSSIRNKNV